MTATEELRRLLNERRVEWTNPNSILRDDMTSWVANGFDYDAFEVPDGTLVLSAAHQDDLTPEQAIAATLGSGTCKLDDFADVPFSVDYEIEGYDMDSGRDYATLAECSACGAYIIVPPEYHHVLTCDGDEVYQPYRFCPNCGRRVV